MPKLPAQRESISKLVEYSHAVERAWKLSQLLSQFFLFLLHLL